MSNVKDVFLFEDESAIGIPVTIRSRANSEGTLAIDFSTDAPELLPDGAITLNPIAGAGQYVMNIRPAPHRHGVATVTVRVSDSAGSVIEQVFIVTVAGVNDVPQPTEDTAFVLAGDAVTIDLHSNEVDHDGDFLRVGLVSVPATGQVVLNKDQTIRYTTDSNSGGPATILYQVDDYHGVHATSAATVQVLRRMVTDLAKVKADATRSVANSGALAKADNVSTVLSASSGRVFDNGDGRWRWEFDPSDGPVVSQTVTVNVNYNQTLQDRVTFVVNAWHNFVNECDVNRDGNVTAFDALLLINYLGRSSGNTGLPSLANTMPWY